MIYLTRRIVSAIVKLDLAGKSHSKRLDAIACILGLTNGETMMALLKSYEKTAKTQDAAPPIGRYELALLTESGELIHKTFDTYRKMEAAKEKVGTSTIVFDSVYMPRHLFLRERDKNPALSYGDWYKNQKAIYIVVTGEASEPEDEGLEGIYEFGCPASTTFDTSEIARAALDEFHGSVGIEVVEDFTIRVMTPTGLILYEEEDQDFDDSFFLSIDLEKIPEDEAPEVLEAFFKRHS